MDHGRMRQHGRTLNTPLGDGGRLRGPGIIRLHLHEMCKWANPQRKEVDAWPPRDEGAGEMGSGC